MKLVSDTDAFCKLGPVLLSATMSDFGATQGTTACLPALASMIGRGRLAHRIPQEVRTELIKFAAGLQRISAATTETLERLRACGDGMDPGDAMLYAFALEHPQCLVLSGDKRAMRALSTQASVCANIQGRVVCVEAALLRLCDRHGTAFVRKEIGPVAQKDVGLQACLASRDLVGALRSYFDDLAKNVFLGLLWDPR